MQLNNLKYLAIVLFCFNSACFAVSPDFLLEKALANGQAEGLIDGPMADGMRQVTHANSTPHMRIVREKITKQGCYVTLTTLTIPDIPSTTGKNLGDYITQTRTQMCPNGDDPLSGKFVEVISCTVGGHPCPNPYKQ